MFDGADFEQLYEVRVTLGLCVLDVSGGDQGVVGQTSDRAQGRRGRGRWTALVPTTKLAPRHNTTPHQPQPVVKAVSSEPIPRSCNPYYPVLRSLLALTVAVCATLTSAVVTWATPQVACSTVCATAAVSKASGLRTPASAYASTWDSSGNVPGQGGRVRER